MANLGRLGQPFTGDHLPADGAVPLGNYPLGASKLSPVVGRAFRIGICFYIVTSLSMSDVEYGFRNRAAHQNIATDRQS
jgi:hypothetical protein